MNGEDMVLARYEIRLSGLGGQGILTMGKLLGQGLALYHGYHVTQTQSYGPEARAGPAAPTSWSAPTPSATPRPNTWTCS